MKPILDWVMSPGVLLELALRVFAACWVWQDASRLRKSGVVVTPSLWAVLVFLVWLVSLPIYLYLRWTTWRSPILTAQIATTQNANQHRLGYPDKIESQRVLFWSISFIFAAVSSMYLTWIAVSRYPIPDSDAINLGLFLFFLVVLLDFLWLGYFVYAGSREGKDLAMAKLGLIFVGGLVAATILGLLPWWIDRLFPARPGLNRTGIAVFFLLFTSNVVELVGAIRRKQRERLRSACWATAGVLCCLFAELSRAMLVGSDAYLVLFIGGCVAVFYSFILQRRMRSNGSTA